MADYVAPGNSAYRGVNSPFLDIKQDILQLKMEVSGIDANSASTQQPVSVGAQGDAHPTIQAAIDAGRFNIVISVDTTVTSDVSIPCRTFLSIQIQAGVTLTMQDAIFKKAPGPGFANIILRIVGGEGSTGDPAATTLQPSTLDMSYTAAPGGAPFSVAALSLSGLNVLLNSPSAPEVFFIATLNLDIQFCKITTDCDTTLNPIIGATSGFLSDVRFVDVSATPVWLIGAQLGLHVASCNFTGNGTTTTYACFGATDIPTTSLSIVGTTFGNMSVGAIANCTWTSCNFMGVTMTSLFGGTTLSGGRSIFIGCNMDTLVPVLSITGNDTQFIGCRIRMGAFNIEVSGDRNTFSACRMESTTGILNITGTNNSVLSCMARSIAAGNLFTINVPAGTALQNKIIGNSVTTAFVPGAATDTYDAGNSILV